MEFNAQISEEIKKSFARSFYEGMANIHKRAIHKGGNCLAKSHVIVGEHAPIEIEESGVFAMYSSYTWTAASSVTWVCSLASLGHSA